MGRAASPDSGGVGHAGGGEGHPRRPRAVRLRQMLSRYCFIRAPPTNAHKVLFYQCAFNNRFHCVLLAVLRFWLLLQPVLSLKNGGKSFVGTHKSCTIKVIP